MSGLGFEMKPDPIILCAVGVLTPIVCFIALQIANDAVASASEAPNQNFMVLSFLGFLLSIAIGVGLFSLGVAMMLSQRRKRNS